ncbi:ribosome-associated toxin RatA of RatAB toxin-antitoxin module [Catenuloplanes nepalensis]|uniref:Ribosome-associated toxin RatA of RatAB toxin-antitoxin module n=1 Tax=Catenuloplanes nepalensis TaxID=587533 RepID=A0ABT9N300_9ACTN|nr:SRPBCC family protein [Catenuloplanes nepalensis]MDP9798026.1 ribosome-associated toxin RatA of RatAB toxin-antitoxin module [Catenuloplanes nepalensis]
MSTVKQAIEVGAPLHAVYEQLSHFENYPQFMSGVQEVTQLSSTKTHWIMDLDGQRREFDAQITECRPDELVAWRATNGPAFSEVITLKPMTAERTQIIAQMDADVAALMPSDRHAQDSLSRRLKADLTSFKRLMENAGFSPHQASGVPLATTMGRAGTNAGMNVGLNKTYGGNEPGITTAGTLSESLTRPTIGSGSGIGASTKRGNQRSATPSPAIMRNRRPEPITQPAGRISAAKPAETAGTTEATTTGATASTVSATGPTTATTAATGGTRRAGEGISGGMGADSTIDLAAADDVTERVPKNGRRTPKQP